MDINKLLRADYLDIIFEGRNKAYGGYELRKKYSRRSRRAGFVVIASALLLCGVPTLASMMGKRATVPVISERVTEFAAPPVLPKEEIVPPTPPPPPARTYNPPPTIAATVPTIVDDKDVEQPVPTVDEMSKTDVGLKTTPGTGRPGDEIEPTAGGMPGGIGDDLVVKRPDPVKFVEQMPQFAGDLPKWLAAMLRYPPSAQDQNIQGRSIIEFIVNEDGSIEGAHVARSSYAALDAEALRVVNAMPKWKPGKQNGKPVRVLFTLPIEFRLD